MSKYEIDARFALGPVQLHFHPDELNVAQQMLVRAVMREKESGIREILEKFPHLDAFQNVLGLILGRDPYDEGIQEAYWIGNSLLEKAMGPNVNRLLLEQYRKHNLPSSYMMELAQVAMSGFPLCHNTQVTKVAVLDTGGLKGSIVQVNKCMVRPAKVMEVSDNRAEVKTIEMRVAEKGYELVDSNLAVGWYPKLMGELKKGDNVALHWGAVAMKLNENQVKNLEDWTRRVVEKL